MLVLVVFVHYGIFLCATLNILQSGIYWNVFGVCNTFFSFLCYLLIALLLYDFFITLTDLYVFFLLVFYLVCVVGRDMYVSCMCSLSDEERLSSKRHL